ncbi:MAG TPA: adenylate/guanylate cyclase domain-containing protein [Candidatus Dormibacteraeota bacterium]|jgi:class 3 adenylate cyclase/ActR/RegA family two-component response regulator
MGRISVLLADDSLIVREGLRALLATTDDVDVVGVAGDYAELVARAEELAPHVIVTDIRMPPTFQREGIDAAQLVRKRHPGTGIVILSQFDDPEYAVALLSEGASGCAYLLKDGVAAGDQLARAIRTVSSGGSLLDPKIVEAMVRPLGEADLSPVEEELLAWVAEGRPIKAIAIKRRTTGADIAASVEQLFFKLAKQATGGGEAGLRNLRRLHQAIVDREEQGAMLSRLLPGGIADRLRQRGHAIGEIQRLVVTVLISDVRGYSGIAEISDPSRLAGQLKEHRTVASDAVLAEHGTVMQFVGDSVMAVFGAPEPLADDADCALRTAIAMHGAQRELNGRWEAAGLPAFELGVGLSTGLVAAALIGSEERAEYSVVGDAVNLAQRLQQFASCGETVLSEATYAALGRRPQAEQVGPTPVKGRQELVTAFRVPALPPGK